MRLQTTLWLTAIATLLSQILPEQQILAHNFRASPDCLLVGISVPMNLTTGDLDGDGHPDLLVASWVRVPGQVEKYDAEQSRVLIFRQRDGHYKLPADQELAIKAPFGMSVGDFDRDGKPDLAISPYGTFDLRLGKEQLLIPHLCPTPNGGAGQVIAGKLNKSGLSDFVSGPVWRTWFGNEKWDQGYFCGPKINDNTRSVMSDLDDDGERDLVFLSAEKEQIRLYYGPFLSRMVAAEELSKFTLLSTGTTKMVAKERSAALPVAALCVGDLNGDERPDIIASTPFHAEISQRKTFIWYQNSPTGFTDNAGPSVTIEGVCGQIAVADVNKDGLEDLVVAEAGDGALRIFRQKRDQPFATSLKEANETLQTGNTHMFQVTDLNGDGYPDVVHNDLVQLRVYLNAGAKAKSD